MRAITEISLTDALCIAYASAKREGNIGIKDALFKMIEQELRNETLNTSSVPKTETILAEKQESSCVEYRHDATSQKRELPLGTDLNPHSHLCMIEPD